MTILVDGKYLLQVSVEGFTEGLGRMRPTMEFNRNTEAQACCLSHLEPFRIPHNIDVIGLSKLRVDTHDRKCLTTAGDLRNNSLFMCVFNYHITTMVPSPSLIRISNITQYIFSY